MSDVLNVLDEMRAVKPIRHASGEAVLIPREQWDSWLLSLSPADDAEQLTSNWLKEVGFQGDDNFESHGPGMWLGVSGLSIDYEFAWRWHGDAWPFKPLMTRGDMRRACEFLQIELKEKALLPAEEQK